MGKTLTNTLYTAEATVTGGRLGHARTTDGVLEVDLAAPVELGGPGGATNPEQLFAAGYAACFQSALHLVGRRRRVDTTGSWVTAKVDLGPVGEGAFGLAVRLEVSIPGVDHAMAEDLAFAADILCPYSIATRANIEVTLTVN